MPDSVVDASAVGALLFGEPNADYLGLAAELGANLLTLDTALMRVWKRHRV